MTALTVTNAVLAGADASVTTPLVQHTVLELGAPTPSTRTLYMPFVTRQFASRADAVDAAPPSPAATTMCPDFSGAARVDNADVQAVAAHWRQRTGDPGWDAAFDHDANGQINVVDVMAVAAAWGAMCPPTLPPDPATVAPPIDHTVATDLFSATRFLYEGNPPIQSGVTPGAITPLHAAVLCGKVLTRDGAPLSGARITVVEHPEYGETLSRADGLFDLVVNGGGALTIRYEKAGYLPSQRQITPAWQSYAWLEEVVLVAYDTQFTTVNLALFSEVLGHDPADLSGVDYTIIYFSGNCELVQSSPEVTCVTKPNFNQKRYTTITPVTPTTHCPHRHPTIAAESRIGQVQQGAGLKTVVRWRYEQKSSLRTVCCANTLWNQVVVTNTSRSASSFPKGAVPTSAQLL